MKAGDKVVLVDDKWPENIHLSYAQLPLKGPCYVVRDVFNGVDVDALTMDMRREWGKAITLIGVNNPRATKPGAQERGFRADRFRLIDELKKENRNVAHQTSHQ